MKHRDSPLADRRKIQEAAIGLPIFPTTTIGSFPQTPEIRKTRAAFRKSEISEADHKALIQKEICSVIARQHEIGLDVLVHGEPERNDIIESIAAMDADVISIETSRSQMNLLDAFLAYDYPGAVGPGVYDIHAPRVPDTAEMLALLEKARRVLAEERIWVNPDCGLKTRSWPEVERSLRNMVAAAEQMRASSRKHCT